MTDFRALDPETRTVALVGMYLQHWAIMEARLNRVLGKALALDDLSAAVVAKNIQLRDKIKITKTLIDLSHITPAEKIDEYKSAVQRIASGLYPGSTARGPKSRLSAARLATPRVFSPPTQT